MNTKPVYTLSPDVVKFIELFGDPTQRAAINALKSGNATNEQKQIVKHMIDTRTNLAYTVKGK
jgi:hypothetical protein